ncbi:MULTISPECIES: DsrH/TusB family sulfur metabolism protein [Marinomonas]|uniref:DsrH/TusB family sulfur metabolism protein n=1 Tax=Marinomonas TaxID=28253 RepID=UPI0022439C83|nr:DsrH/TusB family sulfur metabolism protein [Marinomonas pontica]MCW8356819.1 DsrH/TusB family sulfur relay protein [Marinomonas pontica]
MRLHQINQLDYPATLEATWQNSVQAGDQILLIEEGFLRTIQQTSLIQTLINAKQAELYYLKSDAAAYGLSPKLGIALSDEEWVELTFSAESNISW